LCHRSAPAKPSARRRSARCCRCCSTRLQLAVCPGDSAQWETGSTVGRLHCAVRTDGDVMVFRLDGHSGWETAVTGAEVEVVLLASRRRVVAFDAVTRQRREAVLRGEPAGTDWGAAAYAARTNTLVPIEPVVLMELPDDQEAAS
ncbi:hypothetical protein BAE44_0004948, partial [Dichanthelium oligosanthes]